MARGSGSIEDDHFHQKSDEMLHPCLGYPPSLSHYLAHNYYLNIKLADKQGTC
jgi:hypothetical protein